MVLCMECVHKHAIVVDSSVPDHSILTWEVEMPNDLERNRSEVGEPENYNYISDEYFQSKEILKELHSLEDKMTTSRILEHDIII